MLTILLAAFLAASGADAAQLVAAPRPADARVRELNPLLRSLVDHPVVLGATTIGSRAALAGYLQHERRRHPRAVTIAALALTAATSAIVVHNAQVVRR